jgi:hypothetical protein
LKVIASIEEPELIERIGVMAVQSFDGDHNMGHLWGDVLVLFAVATVLALLTPRGAKAAHQ